MKTKLIYAIMAVMAMTVLSSCEDEDLEKVYDEKDLTRLTFPLF